MGEKEDVEKEELEKARKRVKKMRSFYSSLSSYIVVNIILVVVNLIFDPYNLWFYWVTLFWGIALIIQGLNTFTIKDSFLGDKWEEAKIQEILEKEKKKKSR
jgi:predicted nucleic acid-binding Zn ribbon protein